MGFLGLSLFFVGITLFSNGMNRLLNVDGKSTAIMNLFTGCVLVIGNIIMLAKAGNTFTDVLGYQNVTSGFLFGITYLFIACNYLLKLDLRPFGLYALFASIYAALMAVLSYGTDIRFVLLWGAWSILWLEGFLELVLKLKLEKVFPFLSMAVGLFAAFIPSIYMLIGKW